MPTIITGAVTSIRLISDSSLYVASTGSIIVEFGAAIAVPGGGFGVTAAIDGTVAAASNVAILLGQTSDTGVGLYKVSIGETGNVRSLESDGLNLKGSLNYVLNSGQIMGESSAINNNGSDLFLGNSGLLTSFYGSAVNLTGANATIENTGMIVSVSNGVALAVADHSQITNEGHINGGAHAIITTNSSYVAVVNSGTMSASTGYAVEFDSGVSNSLTNSGIIQSMSGVLMTGSAALVTNSGSILGETLGVLITNSSATVLNHGNITGEGTALIVVGDGTRVRNGVDGHISSANAFGIELDGTLATLANAGEITGEAAGVNFQGDGCYLRNSGIISGLSWGFYANNFGSLGFNEVSAVNSGVISGVNNGFLNQNQTLRLDNSGTIIAQAGSGLISFGKVFLYNTGTIAGGTGGGSDGFSIELGSGDAMVRNFGTLHGSAQFGSGNDLLRNGAIVDGSVFLDIGNDTYYGRGGSVEGSVYGGGGNDVLRGGDLVDRLSGGAGVDKMTGGSGADVFVFAKASEVSSGAKVDHVTDFTTGIDKFDLSGFMGGGSFIGTTGFTGVAGQVRYASETGMLTGDVNGDGAADWTLILDNKGQVVAGDFIF